MGDVLMPSDPTTQDLIEEAREKAHHGWPYTRSDHRTERCPACAIHALADRLEEVEGQRRRNLARAVEVEAKMEEERALPDPGWAPIHRYVSACVAWYLGGKPSDREQGVAQEAMKAAVHGVYRQLRYPDPPEPSDPEPDKDYEADVNVLTPVPSFEMEVEDSDPEPEEPFGMWEPGGSGIRVWSCCGAQINEAHTDDCRWADDPDPDPDTDDVPNRAESVDPEPNHVTDTTNLAEDPEPEDDPWEAIEGWENRDAPDAFMDIRRALLDLRERVEACESHMVDRTWLVTSIARLERRIDDNQKRVERCEGGPRVDLDILDQRVQLLESHADRGSEAEAELRRRNDRADNRIEGVRHHLRTLDAKVRRLEEMEKAALRTRGTLRDDLETLDDHTEALAERVERLAGRAGWLEEDIYDRRTYEAEQTEREP